MKVKSDAKFEEKLTRSLENNMRNFAKFHHNTWKSQNWHFRRPFNQKYVSWQWKIMQNLKRSWLVVSKLTWGIWQIWPEHLKVSEISTWMRSFWTKYILLELKKYIRVIFHDTEEKYKVWRVIKLSFRNWHKKFDKFWPEHSKV